MITRDLLDRFRAGRCTAEEIATLQAYFDQSDPHALDAMLSTDWQEADPNTHLPDGASVRLWQRLVASLQADGTGAVRPLNSRQSVFWRWAVAASVGIMVLGGGLFWARQQGELSNQFAVNQTILAGWLTKSNTSPRPQAVALADGSTVLVQPGSQLSYPAKFSGTLRVVRLAGEAFFEVQPDKTHPFVVQTSSVLVRVLGTSFRVRAFAGFPTAEVAVRTGKVSVSPADGRTTLVLTPNQRATLTVANGQVIKSLVAAPMVVNPKAVENRFAFSDTPVADVFSILERAYGVTIRYDRQKLANCTLTATLTDQPLFTKLEMVCSSMGATYSVTGTDIVVSGSGCE